MDSQISTLNLLQANFYDNFPNLLGATLQDLSELYISPNWDNTEYSAGEFGIEQIAGSGSNLYDELLSKITSSAWDSFLVTGKSGFGKTSLAFQIGHSIWKLRENSSSEVCIPIYINLTEISSDSWSNLVHSMLNLHGSSSPGYIFKQSKILLILDCYDQLPHNKRIYGLDIWKMPSKIKVLTLSRENSIPEEVLLKFRLFEPSLEGPLRKRGFVEYKIQPFSSAQVQIYIQKFLAFSFYSENEKSGEELEEMVRVDGSSHWSAKERYDKYWEYLKAFDLNNIVKSPFLLYLVLVSLPKFIQNSELPTNFENLALTRIQIYNTFCSQWAIFQARKISNRVDLTISELSSIELEIFIRSYQENLAWKFIKVNGHLESRSLTSEETLESWLWEPAANIFLLQSKQSYAKYFQSINNIQVLRDASLLCCSSSQYNFVHRSLLEFFAGQRLQVSMTFEFDFYTRNCSISSDGSSDQFFVRSIVRDRDVLSNLAEKVLEDTNFATLLSTIIDSSKTVFAVRILAANAITILNFAGISFSGQDFQDIQIPGADLSSSICSYTNFERADLSNVNFSKSFLWKTKFSASLMQGTMFGVGIEQVLPLVILQLGYYYNQEMNKFNLLVGYFPDKVIQMDDSLNVLRIFRHETNHKSGILEGMRFSNYDDVLVTWIPGAWNIQRWCLKTGTLIESLDVVPTCDTNTTFAKYETMNIFLGQCKGAIFVCSPTFGARLELFYYDSKELSNSIQPIRCYNLEKQSAQFEFLVSKDFSMVAISDDSQIYLWENFNSECSLIPACTNLLLFDPQQKYIIYVNDSNIWMKSITPTESQPQKLCSCDDLGFSNFPASFISFNSDGSLIAIAPECVITDIKIFSFPTGQLFDTIEQDLFGLHFCMTFIGNHKLVYSFSDAKQSRIRTVEAKSMTQNYLDQLDYSSCRRYSSISLDSKYMCITIELAPEFIIFSINPWEKAKTRLISLGDDYVLGHTILKNNNILVLTNAGKLLHITEPIGTTTAYLIRNVSSAGDDLTTCSEYSDRRERGLRSLEAVSIRVTSTNVVQLYLFWSTFEFEVMQVEFSESSEIVRIRLMQSFKYDASIFSESSENKDVLKFHHSLVVTTVASGNESVYLFHLAKNGLVRVIDLQNSLLTKIQGEENCGNYSVQLYTELDAGKTIFICAMFENILLVSQWSLNLNEGQVDFMGIELTQGKISSDKPTLTFNSSLNWLVVIELIGKIRIIDWSTKNVVFSTRIWYRTVDALLLSTGELYVLGTRNEISCFVQGDNSSWKLLWSNVAPYKLLAYNCNILECRRLSPENQSIMSQYKCLGCPSQNPDFNHLATLYEEIKGTASATPQLPVIQSSGNHDFHISNQTWIVSAVANRWERSQQYPRLNNIVSFLKFRHVFLVIEGFRNNRRFGIRAEMRARGRVGTVLIRALDDFDRFKQLARHCRARQWTLDPEKGDKLVRLILDDVGKTFHYTLHQNNCVKWLIDKLKELGHDDVQIDTHWYNFAVVLPHNAFVEQ